MTTQFQAQAASVFLPQISRSVANIFHSAVPRSFLASSAFLLPCLLIFSLCSYQQSCLEFMDFTFNSCSLWVGLCMQAMTFSTNLLQETNGRLSLQDLIHVSDNIKIIYITNIYRKTYFCSDNDNSSGCIVIVKKLNINCSCN